MSTQKITHVSASQFKTFGLCRRKWFIEKCTDSPKPEPSAAMILGQEVHAVLEEYLQTGVAPDESTREGRIAAAGLHLLPEESVLEIELRIRLEDIDPPLVGFIDVLDMSEPQRPVVIDHKTTSAWKWAKTEEQLKTDPQMIAYARYALDEFPVADVVEVAHVQYKTKGAPEARRVSVLLEREHVDEHWEELKQLATEMKKTSLLDDVEEVTPNLSACGAFGGCPYVDTCAALGQRPNPFAGIERLKSETQKKEDNMSTLRQLLESKKRGKKSPPPIPSNGAPVLSPDAAPRETIVLPAGIDCGEEGQEEAIAESALTFTTPVPVHDKYADDVYSAAANEILKHLRDRQVSKIGVVAARPLVGRILGLKRVRDYYVEKTCLLSEGTLRFEEGTILRGSATAAPEPTPEIVVEEAPAPVEAEPEVAAPKAKAKPKAKRAAPAPEPAATLVLYIDCLPLKGIEKMQTFEDVIEPLIQKVAENNKVASPLLMQYGEGKNHVAGLLRVQCPKGYVVVSSDNPYWASCKTVLIQSADVVIKGTR
tara:strand:+ start:497 stop:2113 length:1617 start_codon:yes stop_codon:yes gene_type:complete